MRKSHLPLFYEFLLWPTVKTAFPSAQDLEALS